MVVDHQDLHSFPTRRSSDLGSFAPRPRPRASASPWPTAPARTPADRKSTRLNSSHEWISYAVFCLKKKTCDDPSNLLPHDHNRARGSDQAVRFGPVIALVGE